MGHDLFYGKNTDLRIDPNWIPYTDNRGMIPTLVLSCMRSALSPAAHKSLSTCNFSFIIGLCPREQTSTSQRLSICTSSCQHAKNITNRSVRHELIMWVNRRAHHNDYLSAPHPVNMPKSNNLFHCLPNSANSVIDHVKNMPMYLKIGPWGPELIWYLATKYKIGLRDMCSLALKKLFRGR